MNASEGPRLCAALPTRNRRDLAVQALESVLPQLRDGDELIVVVSASEDDTHARISELLALRRPTARVIVDDVGGISRARNLILAEAEAPAVCFFDDDELVAPDWIEKLRMAWRQAEADVAVIGGPIRPLWETGRPSWMRDDILYVLSVQDLGASARTLDQTPHVGYVWGGNLSVRRVAALEVGGFDERRGLGPSAPFGRGEEEHLQRCLAARGWRVRYEPSVVVTHRLPGRRTTLRYFRRAFREAAHASAHQGMSRRLASFRLGVSLSRLTAALMLVKRDDVARASLHVSYAWALLTCPRAELPAATRRSER
jgi:glycosyltransferase involved in cell wall biosynthesis